MVEKKYKKFLLFVFLVTLLFWGSGFAHAFEASYPSIPFAQAPSPTCTGNTCLPKFVLYLFAAGIDLAAVLSLISFAVGAIGMISPNPESHKDAKDRMMAALLGLTLTLSAFVIINTINPALKNISLAPLPTITITPPPVSPGVYFYSDASCSGTGTDVAGPVTASTDNLKTLFNKKIQSVMIISDSASNTDYGVILHQAPGLGSGGKCSYPMSGKCLPPKGCCFGFSYIANLNPSAADIFALKRKSDAGTGVTFYSEPNGWNSGQITGFSKIPPDQINAYPSISARPAAGIVFSYEGVIPPGGDAYKSLCHIFYDCPGSIRTSGGTYIIGLYSNGGGDIGQTCNSLSPCTGGETCESGKCKNTGNISYCQTFAPQSESKGIPNLKVQPILNSGGGKIDEIYIIPIQ